MLMKEVKKKRKTKETERQQTDLIKASNIYKTFRTFVTAKMNGSL